MNKFEKGLEQMPTEDKEDNETMLKDLIHRRDTLKKWMINNAAGTDALILERLEKEIAELQNKID